MFTFTIHGHDDNNQDTTGTCRPRVL